MFQLVTVFVFFSVNLAYPQGSQDLSWLITPDEAALAPANPREDIQTRNLNDGGPSIDVVKPQDGDNAGSPAEILVRFLPRTATIDLTSLKVTLLKFISIDLTERLKPYINLEGISVKDAKIPAGSYRVRISLSDVGGHTTNKDISFTVR